MIERRIAEGSVCLQSRPETARALRLLMAPIVGACSLVFFSGRPLNAIGVCLGLLLLLAMVSLISVAEVRGSSGSLEYCRLGNWKARKAVPFGDIRSCRMSWFPMVGKLQLNSWLWPWGALYFVMPRSGSELCFPRTQTAFTRWVNSRRCGEGPVPSNSRTHGDRSWRNGSITAAALGFAYAMTLHAVVAPRRPPDSFWEGLPLGLVVLHRISDALLNWPWGLVTCAALCTAALSMGRDKRAWIAFFVCAALLTSLFFRRFA